MARKEVQDAEEVAPNTDQGPYTGQSMDMPPSPFQPEDITVLGYDDEGNPVLAETDEEVAPEDEE